MNVIEQEAELIRLRERLQKMAALLDRMPHDKEYGRAEHKAPSWCHGDCPACAWEKLKKEKL